jgi:hypothetical protein
MVFFSWIFLSGTASPKATSLSTAELIQCRPLQANFIRANMHLKKIKMESASSGLY